MTDTINILVLEDSKVDYMMAKRAILKNAPNALLTQAATRGDFEKKIAWMEYDLILADYNLPGYNGLDALLFAREHYPYVPFIFLSGDLDDQSKVAQAILRGANDYESKDNLPNLWSKIENVLTSTSGAKKERQERENRERKVKLQLQKASSYLAGAPDFDKKQEILDILRSVSTANR